MLVIEANIPEVILELDAFRRQQLPFATSLAVNTVAKTARAEQVAGIFERFTVRRPARLRTSVAFQASNKRDLEATLTVRDTFLAQHEERVTRRRGDVSSAIVQPEGDEQKRIGVLRGRNTPKALLARGKGRKPGRPKGKRTTASASGLRKPAPFVATMKSGKVGVFVRRDRRQRLPIELLFAFEREVKLPGLLKFGATAERVVTRDWEREFGRSLARALASRR